MSNVFRLRRLSFSVPRPSVFNPAANRFFVDDQPIEPVLPLTHLMAGSPPFARYARQVRWLRDGDQGIRRAVWAARIGVVSLYLLLILYMLAAETRTQPTSPLALAQAAVNASGALLLLGLVGALVTDLICFAAALRVHDRGPMHDLLCLSRVSSRGIIISQYAAVRLQGWRWMNVVFHLRIVGVLTFILSRFLVVPLAEHATYGASVKALDGFDRLIEYGIVLSLSIVFVAEARWRLDGVSAWALAAAARQDEAVPPAFRVLFSALLLWIMQVVVLVIALFFMISLSLVVINFLENAPLPLVLQSALAIPCGIGITLLLRWMVQGHYRAMIARELRLAQRSAFPGVATAL
ncbi:MAG: hypothetical protein IPK19_41665 [Chloroflexi bacterium]|nr:hypothetical protein [Chloroflexota bacterium]